MAGAFRAPALQGELAPVRRLPAVHRLPVVAVLVPVGMAPNLEPRMASRWVTVLNR